jgi:hypothetical protein
LGPAMQVTPPEMASDIFFAMDLNPLISILDNFTPQGLAELDSRCKHPYELHSLTPDFTYKMHKNYLPFNSSLSHSLTKASSPGPQECKREELNGPI